MAFKKWREKGESFRVDRYLCIEGRCLHQIMSAKTKVTKTKTALKQETYNLSDLKHDPHCGFAGLVGFRFLLDSGLHVADAVTEAPLAAARDVDDAAPLVTAA